MKRVYISPTNFEVETQLKILLMDKYGSTPYWQVFYKIRPKTAALDRIHTMIYYGLKRKEE